MFHRVPIGILSVVFVLGACSGPASTVPTETPVTTVTSVPSTAASTPVAAGAVWTLVSDPDALRGVVLYGIAAGPGGFTAVGTKDEYDSLAFHSSDGATWTAPTDVLGLSVRAIAGNDNGYALVGQATWAEGQYSHILTSDDGLSFHDLNVPGPAVVLNTVAVTEAGYVAAGELFHCQPNETLGQITMCGYVFFSDDGVTWTSAPQGPEFDDSQVNAVVAGGPGFIAVGWAPDARRAVAWTSASGTEWQRSADSPSFDDAGMLAVIADGTGFLAVGWNGATGAAVWKTVDGSSWTRVPDSPELSGAKMYSVIKLRDGYVAVGSGSTGAVAWTSADGTTWTKAHADDSFTEAKMISVAAIGNTVVAVGPQMPGGRSSAIWTSP